MSPSGTASKPLLAFFGATGGCTNAVLVLALNAGYDCTALARTPSKLTDMLAAKGVSSDTVAKHLSIVKGDIKDVSSVKSAICYRAEPADIIISGIGMVLSMKPDTTICQKAAATIVSALRELGSFKRPFIVVISTTGINRGPRDIPYAVMPLYHLLLAAPHADKKVMEQTIIDAGTGPNAVFGGYTLVRPSLLSNGKECGMMGVKVGSEEKPAVGYTISRMDVGRWIFEETVAKDARNWNRMKPSITY